MTGYNLFVDGIIIILSHILKEYEDEGAKKSIFENIFYNSTFCIRCNEKIWVAIKVKV